MQDHNITKQAEILQKLNKDRAWLLENIDRGRWPEIRIELAEIERKISKLIINLQENNFEI